VLDDLAEVARGVCAGLMIRRSDAWIGWRVSPGVSASADAYLRSEAARGASSPSACFRQIEPDL